MTTTEIRDAHAGCLIERRWADRDAALIAEVQQMVTNLQTFLLGQRKLANLETTKDALLDLSDRLDDAVADSIAVIAREFERCTDLPVRVERNPMLVELREALSEIEDSSNDRRAIRIARAALAKGGRR